MLQSRCAWSLRVMRPSLSQSARFTSTPLVCSQPNGPLDLDPSLQALLKDVDISLMRAKSGASLVENTSPLKPVRELEVFSVPEDEENSLEDDLSAEDGVHHWDIKKSPAAHFGSRRIGQVVIPLELQNSIDRLIAESDKSMLHQDAKRLFMDETENQWHLSYDTKYKSRQQAGRHRERDGTAFASVALPAHYSAIYSVLDHVKRRLGPDWKVGRIIDWGAGTGSGLWAAGHCFQSADSAIDRQLALSTVFNYVGIDRRDGLVSIGKRLLQNIEMGDLKVSWRKSLHEEDTVERARGGDFVALSAFQLSSLPNPLAKKELVKEMWESGASVIILIDHSTTEGFESIAEARQKILTMGRKELQNPDMASWPSEIKGAHVVAPCPHDGTCPLYHPGSTRLVCGFSQRLQRPEFIRRTKHSGTGHEDVGYSYVVIRRGERPAVPEKKVGRIGSVGARVLEKLAFNPEPLKELRLVGEHHEHPSAKHEDVHITGPTRLTEVEGSFDEIQDQLRLEAFSWPRLVFPPLKRSGHVIIDACTHEAKIMRMTIPKSQGKQPFYDARKSSWGDIFPHEPKNAPQERHQPTRARRAGDTTPVKGSDIGKRKNLHRQQAASYASLDGELKERADKLRQQRVRNRDSFDDLD